MVVSGKEKKKDIDSSCKAEMQLCWSSFCISGCGLSVTSSCMVLPLACLGSLRKGGLCI